MVKIPRPHSPMDDTQPNALVALGAVLMSGAIAWVIGISVVGMYSWPVRVLPPAAMFVVGAALVIVAIRGGGTLRRAVLARAIADGRALLKMPQGAVQMEEHAEWHNRVYGWLRDHHGLEAAHGFANATADEPAYDDLGQHFNAIIRAQIRYLEAVKQRL